MSQSSPKGTPFRLWLILGNFEQIKFLKFSQKKIKQCFCLVSTLWSVESRFIWFSDRFTEWLVPSKVWWISKRASQIPKQCKLQRSKSHNHRTLSKSEQNATQTLSNFPVIPGAGPLECMTLWCFRSLNIEIRGFCLLEWTDFGEMTVSWTKCVSIFYFEHFLNVVCELHTRFQTLWHHNHSFVNSHHLNSTLNALQSVLRTIKAIPNIPVPSSWLRKLSSSGHDFESTFLRFAKGKRDSKKYPDIFETPGLGINLHLIFRGADI